MLVRHEKKIFQTIDDELYLNPDELDFLLTTIRHRLWSFQLRQEGPELLRAVTEVVPIGSKVSEHGYLTPKGTFVSNRLRKTVAHLRGLYQETETIQERTKRLGHISPQVLEEFMRHTRYGPPSRSQTLGRDLDKAGLKTLHEAANEVEGLPSTSSRSGKGSAPR